MFKLDNMSFRYNDWIFFRTSCEVLEQHVGIIGNNGAGKTTLLKLLNNELSPQEGTITKPDSTYLVSFEAKHYGRFTPRELMSMCQRLNRFDDCFDELISVLGFHDMMDICLKKLSLGSVKKVFLMLGLAAHCDLLLLDEPFDNLDMGSCMRLTEYLREKKQNFVIVSHNQELLASCVEEIWGVKEKGLVRV